MVFNYSKMANLGLRMDCNTFWDIFGTSKQITKSRPFGVFFSSRNASTNMFFISRHSRNPQKCQFWKRQAPNNDEDSLNKYLNILDMVSISSRKHEIDFWPYGISETLKLWSQETLKPRNFEANKL